MRLVSWRSLAAAVLVFSSLVRVGAQSGPVPVVTVAPPGQVLVGENTTLNVTFRNAGTAVGYGPFVDFILPATGADGAGAEVNDGVTFVSATYLGFPIPTELVYFSEIPPSGQVQHPFLLTPTGAPAIVFGPPGDQLVSLRLPFSSTPTQPAVDIAMTVHVSDLADVGVPLLGSVRAGFQYGAGRVAGGGDLRTHPERTGRSHHQQRDDHERHPGGERAELRGVDDRAGGAGRDGRRQLRRQHQRLHGGAAQGGAGGGDGPRPRRPQ